MTLFRYVSSITHDLVSEAFSNKDIVPDVTTTNDVAWAIRQKITDIGVYDGFSPTITLQRSDKDISKYDDPADYFRVDIPPREICLNLSSGEVISSALIGALHISVYLPISNK